MNTAQKLPLVVLRHVNLTVKFWLCVMLATVQLLDIIVQFPVEQLTVTFVLFPMDVKSAYPVRFPPLIGPEPRLRVDWFHEIVTPVIFRQQSLV